MKRRLRIAPGVAVALAFASWSPASSSADSAKSQILDRALQSKSLAQNRIGASPIRKMVVYLPAGYEGSSQRYPVIYFFPDPSGGYLRPDPAGS